MSDEVDMPEKMEQEEGCAEGKLAVPPVVQEGQEEEGEELRKEKRVFSCQYCPKRFNSLQALGGHQNTHKQERYAVRRARKDLESYTLPSLPYLPTNHYKILDSPRSQSQVIATAMTPYQQKHHVQSGYLPPPTAIYRFYGPNATVPRASHFSNYESLVEAAKAKAKGKAKMGAPSPGRSCVLFGKKIVASEEEDGHYDDGKMVRDLGGCRPWFHGFAHDDMDDDGNGGNNYNIDLSLHL